MPGHSKKKWISLDEGGFERFLGCLLLIGVYKSKNEAVTELWSHEMDVLFSVKLLLETDLPISSGICALMMQHRDADKDFVTK